MCVCVCVGGGGSLICCSLASDWSALKTLQSFSLLWRKVRNTLPTHLHSGGVTRSTRAIVTSLTWLGGSSGALRVNGRTPAPTALLPVCRFIGSEVATFCPFRCAVTMETGTLVGTTEMAMP